MFEADTPRARLRTLLITAIILTIPCYCIGFIALSIAPTPPVATEIPSPTFPATFTSTAEIPTATATATPTFGIVTLTPFQASTNTPFILSPTPSMTPTFTATSTFTDTPTNTFTPTATFTPSYTPTEPFTITPSITPITPTPTLPTPSPTAFGGG